MALAACLGADCGVGTVSDGRGSRAGEVLVGVTVVLEPGVSVSVSLDRFFVFGRPRRDLSDLVVIVFLFGGSGGS